MAFDLTAQILRNAVPKLSVEKSEQYVGLINAAMREFDINTAGPFSIYRVAVFLAQTGHETLSFHTFTELGSGANYELSSNPRLAAELGNTTSGDGIRYRGRGALQVTGKFNYERISKVFGVDFVGSPEKAASLEWAFRIAGWYWNQKGLNALADAQRFEAITRKINGGLNGQDDRLERYTRALAALRDVARISPALVAATPGRPVPTTGSVASAIRMDPNSNTLPVKAAELPWKGIMWGLGVFGVGMIAFGQYLKHKGNKEKSK